MPAWVSCTRGAGLPAQGSGDKDFTTTAPSEPRSKYGASSAPCPDVPDAVSTGLASSTEPTRVVRSTETSGLRRRDRSIRMEALEGPHLQRVAGPVGHAIGRG